MTKNTANTAQHPNAKRSTVVVKKYPNRRLYDTQASTYITLETLCEMVKRGVDFIVLDAKTNIDLTRQVLTQIIFEKESEGYNLLPIKFLRTIIGFYGGNVQQFLPPYLEASMESFLKNQDKMHEYVSAITYSPFSQLEELGKQNMALFQRAFSVFSPFDMGKHDAEDESKPTNHKK